ncbi:MBL fold metallo-hydrolase [Mycobacterium sp. WMMD1722]|uniref:MBL fold metallo-hydrolase n=1 Tax=Mycobacterium sp. WMMD1722 TaxID=3404117 RepID=UPI003BF5BF8A
MVTTAIGHFLIDAGTSTIGRLAQAGLRPDDLTAVFLTHLHDDHTVGLTDLLSFRYTSAIYGPPQAPLTIIGPPGTHRLITALSAVLDVSGGIRRSENNSVGPPVAATVIAKEVGEGAVYDTPQLRVAAVENTHYSDRGTRNPAGSASYSYRVETPEWAIGFTGDTGPSAAVTMLFDGVDAIVAEMVSDELPEDFPPGVDPAALRAGHLRPSHVADMASGARAGRVILSHYNEATPTDLSTIGSAFNGPVTAGTDLLQPL